MATVFCRGCGKQLDEAAFFCPSCGAPQRAGGGGAENTVVPDGVKGWSWGAFLLNWIWAIFNRTWIGLLALLIPFVGGFLLAILGFEQHRIWPLLLGVVAFAFTILLGFKGREWAWRNKKWDSVEHFNRVQRRWSFWGVLIVVATFLVGVLAAIVVPQYQSYLQRATSAQTNSQSATAQSPAIAAATTTVPPADAQAPVSANTALIKPKFKDYAVDVYTGDRREPVITKENADFRTKIRETAQMLINFAGHYVIQTWGCGSGGCVTGVMVDAQTGRVGDFLGVLTECRPQNGEPISSEMYYKADSRLFVSAGMRDEPDSTCETRYFEEQNGTLKLIHREPFLGPVGSSAGAVASAQPSTLPTAPIAPNAINTDAQKSGQFSLPVGSQNQPNGYTTNTTKPTAVAQSAPIPATVDESSALATKLIANKEESYIARALWTNGGGVSLTSELKGMMGTDNFGEKPWCLISLPGRGPVAATNVAKWRLVYRREKAKGDDIVFTGSWEPESAPPRISFDDDTAFINAPRAALSVSNVEFARRLPTAKSVTLKHAADLAFTYDAQQLRLAQAIARKACP